MRGRADPKNMKQIVISKGVRRKIQRVLAGANVSMSSLSPGLDGYACSLGSHFPFLDPASGDEDSFLLQGSDYPVGRGG
jgi:hypothetical protein